MAARTWWGHSRLNRHNQDYNVTEVNVVTRLLDYLNCDIVGLPLKNDPLISLTAMLLGRTYGSVDMKLRNLYEHRHPGHGLSHGNKLDAVAKA